MTFLKTRSGDFVGTPPQVENKRSVRGGGARYYQSMRFQTYSHLWYPSGDPRFWYPSGDPRLWSDALRAPSGLPYFKFYDSLFYIDYKYKGLRRRAKPGAPENIHELLTPRAIAYWFMDDGNSDQNCRHRSYMFSTHSFPWSDQALLVQVLRYNFDIDATIQKLIIDYIFVKNLRTVF